MEYVIIQITLFDSSPLATFTWGAVYMPVCAYPQHFASSSGTRVPQDVKELTYLFQILRCARKCGNHIVKRARFSDEDMDWQFSQRGFRQKCEISESDLCPSPIKPSRHRNNNQAVYVACEAFIDKTLVRDVVSSRDQCVFILSNCFCEQNPVLQMCFCRKWLSVSQSSLTVHIFSSFWSSELDRVQFVSKTALTLLTETLLPTKTRTLHPKLADHT